MKIITNKGIKELAKSYLATLPLNKRMDLASEVFGCCDRFKRKVIVAEDFGHYEYKTPDNGNGRKINILGPLEDIPESFVVNNPSEKKEILNFSKGNQKRSECNQLQLYFMGNLTLIQELETVNYDGRMRRSFDIESLDYSPTGVAEKLERNVYRILGEAGQEVPRDYGGYDNLSVICNSLENIEKVKKVFNRIHEGKKKITERELVFLG